MPEVLDPITSEPVPVSRKPESIKTAVTLAYRGGHSKAKIARDLNISVNTVKKIIRERDLDAQIRAVGEQVIDIAPDAVRCVHRAITKGDANIAMRVVDRVMDMQEQLSTRHSDPTINIAIAQLLPKSERAPQLDTAPRDVIDITPSSSSTTESQD